MFPAEEPEQFSQTIPRSPLELRGHPQELYGFKPTSRWAYLSRKRAPARTFFAAS